jgi:hypothetical protein
MHNTNSSPLDTYVQALSIVLQQNNPNELHDAATFAKLLCVSKQL